MTDFPLFILTLIKKYALYSHQYLMCIILHVSYDFTIEISFNFKTKIEI